MDVYSAAFLKSTSDMFFYLNIVSGFSILLPAVIGVLRFRKILQAYRPFVFYACVGLINELSGTYLNEIGKSNELYFNLYVLIEFYLILWLFRNWRYEENKLLFQASAVILSAIWLFDCLIIHSIEQHVVIFELCYSFLVIFLSIDQMNHVIVTEKQNVFLNSRFVICSGFLVFYTYKALTEIFLLVIVNVSMRFLAYVYTILIVINFITNLIHAYAAVWIPKKQKFILPY
jgi:hypothetical protein